MKRVCVDCGRITEGRRCPTHRRAYEARRGPRSMKGRYDWEWRKLVAQAIREHPWCTECRTPGAPDNPLTGDHITPHRAGGRNERSNIQVLCRGCNSRKGARPSIGGRIE